MFPEAHSIRCCSPDGRLRVPADQAESHCFPIIIPEDDPVYSKFQLMCMNFVRSQTTMDQGCAHALQPAEQVSSIDTRTVECAVLTAIIYFCLVGFKHGVLAFKPLRLWLSVFGSHAGCHRYCWANFQVSPVRFTFAVV